MLSRYWQRVMPLVIVLLTQRGKDNNGVAGAHKAVAHGLCALGGTSRRTGGRAGSIVQVEMRDITWEVWLTSSCSLR